MVQLNHRPIATARVLLVAALLAGSLLVILATQHAAAAILTFNVDSTADAGDAAPGDGVCATAGGVCTLRAAIEEANHANHALDTKFITVYLPGTYLLSSQLVVTGQDIFIYGTGDASDVIIDGGSVHRIIDVGVGASVSVFWVTLQNGRNGTSVVVPGHFHGGAIHNHGDLTLGHVVIKDSVAGDVVGGTMNCVTTCGGALYNAGPAQLDSVTLIGNQATLDGGAIYNGSTLTAENITVSDNSTDTGTGAAIANVGTADVTHATVAGNSSAVNGAISSTAGTLTLTASIAAGNTADNCSGTITNGGFNISYPDGSCPGLNMDPMLDPAGAQDHGGATPTIALLWQSPAIDLIPAASCLLTADQRGVARPMGEGCDAGAYEFIPQSGDVLLSDLKAHILATMPPTYFRSQLVSYVDQALIWESRGHEQRAAFHMDQFIARVTQYRGPVLAPSLADDYIDRAKQIKDALGY